MYKRFKFVKPYKSFDGEIAPGAQLDVINGNIMFNGGMLEPSYYKEFKDLIVAEMNKPHYLREVPVPYNKV